MITAFFNSLVAMVLALLVFSGGPAHAQDQSQGRIGTLVRGPYTCELPGNAAGRAGVEQEKLSFTVASASRYASAAGGGTYLRRGDVMVMTSGPRNGERYRIISERFLRKLDDGKPGRLRCIHREK